MNNFTYKNVYTSISFYNRAKLGRFVYTRVKKCRRGDIDLSDCLAKTKV